jgi:hypothetical protein
MPPYIFAEKTYVKWTKKLIISPLRVCGGLKITEILRWLLLEKFFASSNEG